MEHAHRPQAGTHGGGTKIGRDHFFLASVAVPQHVKAVLNRLESGAVFSAMSVDGVEGELLVCARGNQTNWQDSAVLEELSKRGMRSRNEPEPGDHGSKGYL